MAKLTLKASYIRKVYIDCIVGLLSSSVAVTLSSKIAADQSDELVIQGLTSSFCIHCHNQVFMHLLTPKLFLLIEKNSSR
jgi:hypothetical protein